MTIIQEIKDILHSLRLYTMAQQLEDAIHNAIVRPGITFSTAVIFKTPVLPENRAAQITPDGEGEVMQERENTGKQPQVQGTLSPVSSLVKRSARIMKKSLMLTNPHYRAIARSGLLDSQYYFLSF